MRLESALLIETPEQIYARVFETLKPRTPTPPIKVKFRRFANANSIIRMKQGALEVHITDLLAEAPAPILEALAFILLSKLFRKPVAPAYANRYRLYMNRKDVRGTIHQIRRERGRKDHRGPEGATYHLVELFEELNLRFFHGLMSRPELGWSGRPSRTLLGHYDPSHHAIILSSLLDRPEVPRMAVEFVLYHEMLHLRFPTEHRGSRRCVHTPEFKAAEREFPGWQQAREALKQL
jgi:hypothetical protein